MLKVLGWIHLALVAAIVGFWLVLVATASADKSLAPQTLGYIVGFFVFLIGPLLIPSLVGGLGLVFGQGWAKIVMFIASVLFLLAFPIGTPLGVFGLWVLWKTLKGAGVPSPAATPSVRIANPLKAISGRQDQRRYRAERAAWLDRLRQDPARAPYAARVEAGEPWTDERIDYDLDPAARAACLHLANLEGDMRAAGIAMQFQREGHVDARCCIDQDRLAKAYALPDGVGYQEVPAYDRSLLDPPAAMIACREHACAIHVLRPSEAAVGTPVFPAG